MKLTPNTVPNFNLQRYLGKWYQIATIPSWFQKNLVNVTATYSLKQDGNINVINKGFGKNTGFISSIKGIARVPDVNMPASLKVKFFFSEADYFVLEVEENYQWAMVGGSDKNSLWILSRKKYLSETIYQGLSQIALDRGYNISKLIITK
jgi:lipocalin